MNRHIALLGDSILDNGAYTDGEPDVAGHLRGILPSGWRVSLYALDGSTISDLRPQLKTVSADTSYIVISIGGNDVLSNSDLLDLPMRSTKQALALFGDRAGRFEASYRTAIEEALSLERETTLCTIYNGNLEPSQAPLARTALTIFNDVILRVAFEQGLAVIDLRIVCDEAEDYANPIEPSGAGGRKIAFAIAHSIGEMENTGAPRRVARISRVFIG